MRTSIDILLTWLVNHDREFLQGGADRGDEARHEGVSVFRDAEHGAADGCRIGRARGGHPTRCGR